MLTLGEDEELKMRMRASICFQEVFICHGTVFGLETAVLSVAGGLTR